MPRSIPLIQDHGVTRCVACASYLRPQYVPACQHSIGCPLRNNVACMHARKSGRLSFDDAGMVVAHLACDDRDRRGRQIPA